LLVAESWRPVPGGTRPGRVGSSVPELASYWMQTVDALQEAVDAAQTDPGVARQLLVMFTVPTRN
jgi:hypothetical protein